MRSIVLGASNGNCTCDANGNGVCDCDETRFTGESCDCLVDTTGCRNGVSCYCVINSVVSVCVQSTDTECSGPDNGSCDCGKCSCARGCLGKFCERCRMEV